MRVPTCPARIGPSWTVTSESGVEPNLRKCANSSRDRDYHALYQGPTLVGPQAAEKELGFSRCDCYQNQLLQSTSQGSVKTTRGFPAELQ
jgi:hypothetical protein